jgi:UDP-glucose 4-epimerase
MGQRVLITGAANWLGSALAGELLTDPEVELVVALDTRAPALPADPRAVHVEADIRTPELARMLAPHAPDVVVHNEVLQFAEPGRSARLLHEINVMGTLQLLAACAALPSVRALVVRSASAIYGSEPNAPSFFTEAMANRFPQRTRWQRDVAELEKLVEGHARRHPGVVCTILRPQPIVGAGLDTPIMRLLRSPVIPTWLGYDPRIQVVHGDDVVGALATAVRRPVSGPVNVAGDGTVALSRMIRRLRRIPVPLAAPAFGPLTGLAAGLGLPPIGPDVARYLRYGRGVDTTRMREDLGFAPRYSTIEAIEATAEVRG